MTSRPSPVRESRRFAERRPESTDRDQFRGRRPFTDDTRSERGTSAGGTHTHGLPAATEGLRRGRSLATKLLLTASLITVTAAIVGIGAFAVFTNTAAVTRTDATGTVTLNPISGNAVNNRLSLGASNLAAGDTIQRTVDIKNTGSITLLGVTLTTNATGRRGSGPSDARPGGRVHSPR